MKKITDYLKVETVNLNLEAKDKKAVLKELFEQLQNSSEITDKSKCYEDLLEREKLGSTGIGEGFAIPHAKSDFVKELIMTVGISKNPIEYDAVAVSYTHLTLPTTARRCRSRWSPYH